MEIEEVNEIYDESKKRRVIIFRRDTDNYGYEEEHYSDDPFEKCWIPVGRRVVGIYDSQEKAEIEARANINWLKNL